MAGPWQTINSQHCSAGREENRNPDLPRGRWIWRLGYLFSARYASISSAVYLGPRYVPLCLAPSVLEERVQDYFELDHSPYMLLCADVKPELRNEIIFQHKNIHLGSHKAFICILRRTDNRFPPHIEALGNRSIIGDARSAQMQSKLNLKIKYRESFRPFISSLSLTQLQYW